MRFFKMERCTSLPLQLFCFAFLYFFVKYISKNGFYNLQSQYYLKMEQQCDKMVSPAIWSKTDRLFCPQRQ